MPRPCPDRAPHELVFVADLTVELRAWPTDTWAQAERGPAGGRRRGHRRLARRPRQGPPARRADRRGGVGVGAAGMTMCASSSASGSPSRSGRPGGGGCTSPADAGPVTASSSSGHPQAAAESAVDSIVRTPGRGSAALPDTGHCRSRPDGHSRTWPPLLFPHRRLGVAMPGGGRSCSSHFEWPWPAAAAVLSTASGRAPHELPCPRWLPHGPPRVRAGGWTPAVGRTLRLEPQAAGTSLAADISLADACRTPSVWTPSVRTAVVPEAADGQSADGSDPRRRR
jgi:hypothetical protein